MDFLALVRAAFGLLLTLGLVGLAAYAGRRWGPAGLFQVRPTGPRRMTIVETLSLGPTSRLVLVKVDGDEKLVLLGDGSVQPLREGGRRG
jgi:flagellar protein FliO/FliZ